MRTLLALSVLLAALMTQAETKTYTVEGMTCGGCVGMVKANVCKIPGLDACKVEVGKVVVTAAHLDDDQISAAVAKAGEYKVVKVSDAEPAAGKSAKPAKKASK